MPSFNNRSCTCGNLNIIEISLAKLCLASEEIWKTFSRQLKAISMMSLFSSKCWDFSFVKITMNDFMRASRSSACFSSIYSGLLWERLTSPTLVAFNWGELSLKMRLLANELAGEAVGFILAAGWVDSKLIFYSCSRNGDWFFIMFSTWRSASISICYSVLLDLILLMPRDPSAIISRCSECSWLDRSLESSCLE